MSVDTRLIPLRQARRLGVFTVAWNMIEAAIAITSGLIAGSVVLTGFGLDSGIEVVSALLVLGRLRAGLSGKVNKSRERRALKSIGVAFYALAAYLSIDGIYGLVSGSRPDTSVVGIVISAAALVVMPVLSVAKRRAGHQIGSPLGAVVLADASMTRLCALLALTTLLGLLAYSVANWWWADPVAAFAIVFFALREGKEAWEGDLD